MRLFIFLLLFVNLSFYGQAQNPPKPYGAIPSARQLKWHQMKYYAFVHFNMNTFTDIEWGHGTESPNTFNPSELDCRQWAKVCKEAGMEGIVITAKHHDGFCLWPSKYTEHSVKNSQWRNGKGDVLKELSAACKEYGLKFGVYLSPWDRNHPAYGKPEYNEVFKKTLQEVLTQYGDVFEVWFDGANGEGPNGKKQTYDWLGFIATVRKYQPNAVIFSGVDIRWIGNEEGYAEETNWSTLNRSTSYPEYPNYWELTRGHEGGTDWIPAEVNCSIRPGWYYHASEDDQVKSLAHLTDIYYSSVGRNGNWLLNLPVDCRGLVHEKDVEQLMALKAYTDEAFAQNLATGKKVSASNIRGKNATYAPMATIDAKKSTYWATDDNVTQASLEIDLGKPTPLNRLWIEEYIALGQRVKKFSVEAWDGKSYQKVAQGTTIGNRRILRFPTVTASKIRVNIEESKACPAISTIALYNAPELIVNPEIRRNKAGIVSIYCEKTTDPVITYTTDGSEPTVNSTHFTEPFALPAGGTVKARAFVQNGKKSSSTITASFDISQSKWKVVATDEAMKGYEGEKAIDGDLQSMWHTEMEGDKTTKKPHAITLDLGETLTLKGFTYLPRQDKKPAGIVYLYALYLSQDGQNWGQSVSTGAFANILNSPILQKIRFDQPRQARYLKFEALEAASAPTSLTSVAELGVITRE